MTVMTRLADRGVLRRSATGASYTYSAVYSEPEYGALVTQRLVRDLVTRFGDLALAQFAAELERLDPERLRQLRRLAGKDPDA
jgi:predicted transcriptional regulator